jgi:hypothetical protein
MPIFGIRGLAALPYSKKRTFLAHSWLQEEVPGLDVFMVKDGRCEVGALMKSLLETADTRWGLAWIGTSLPSDFIHGSWVI